MSTPRAVGVRISYADVPTAVTGWVEARLGSPVVSYADQVGGMSPGCATRVVCADGTRAFVKAVGADLNAHTPTLFRREIAVLDLIGEHPLWARLEASYDDGDWVALVLEDVEGRHPDLSDDVVMGRLLEATDDLSVVLGERTPREIATGGGTYDTGLTGQHSIFRQFADSVETLTEIPDAPVPAWVRADTAGWAKKIRTLAEHPMTTLVHYDIRVDNLLQRPTGEIVFVDWGGAGIGPDWIDPLLARLERVDQGWFDASLASSEALVRIGDEAVTTWLVGIGTHLAVRSVTAVDVNLPTLQEFRRTESARFLGAAARRL
ncbi:phosphotransferase [Nocardioides albertanoniae]|uniref:phosphotransferase n=1 Tax=Nocardioides albertanoniae TaxID=1175486 RepID=UPI00114E5A01|nr:phosphotransferase [Nocardioides albertanoniae]